MAEKDIIIMRQKDLKQLHVIHKVLEKRIKQCAAGKLAGLSTRQIRRKSRRVLEEGDKGITHRSRGKPSHNAKPEGFKEKVREIYRKKYWDFGPTLASEKLQEIDKVKISDETLRRWLIESGDWQKRKKTKKHRRWRERKHYFGEMLQGDGSHHKWFEDRGSECVLMGFIDDATGSVYARFYEYEGTIPVMDLTKKYIRKYGIPGSLYMDNHSTYKSQKKATIEDELAGRQPLSQFERSVKELGMGFIHARSPQAKGRIERLFKTFQDRVIKEMRLVNVSSIREGNQFLRGYLPKYNKKFGVMAKKTTDIHRKQPEGIDLDAYLCIKTSRTIRNDYTVSHNRKLYQITSRTKDKKVTVEERISGKIVLREDSGRVLDSIEIKSRPTKQSEKKVQIKQRYPSKDETHPWRKWVERGYPQNPGYAQRKKKEAKKKEKRLLLVH
jgi:hypothetical protein